jgi:hypothetical protein
VTTRGHPLERLQPWLAEEVAVAAPAAKGPDFDIAWRDLPGDAALVPARKLVLPVKVTRADDKSAVRLTLVTSQVVRLVNNQPDPNQTLKLDKAVELGAKMSDADPTVIVPPALAGPVYDLTIQAELLTPDKKTVLATAFAPVKRLDVRPLIALKIDGPIRREVSAEAKKELIVKLDGEVERRDGVTGDVTLTVTGLPAGARSEAPLVKAGAKTFAVKLVLPAGTGPGEIGGVKLAGTVVADPKQPNVRVKSRDLELTLVVQAAK